MCVRNVFVYSVWVRSFNCLSVIENMIVIFIFKIFIYFIISLGVFIYEIGRGKIN